MSDETTNPPETTETPSTETTSTTTTQTPPTETKPEGEEPKSLVSGGVEGAGEEGDKGADSADGQADFVPLTTEDITVPEGMTLDAEASKQFLDIVNEAKLPKEAMQKLVDLQAGLEKAASDRISQAVEDLQTKWADESRALPEFGGANLKSTITGITKLIEGYGGDAAAQGELKHVFDLTGVGNNPHMIAFLGRISKALVTEGTPETGQETSGKSAKTLAQRMFPNLS